MPTDVDKKGHEKSSLCSQRSRKRTAQKDKKLQHIYLYIEANTTESCAAAKQTHSRRKWTPDRKALWCFHSPLFRLSITGSMTVFKQLPASPVWVPMVEGEELFVMKEQSFTALTCPVAPSRTNAKGLSICNITQHFLRVEKLLHREHFLRKIQQQIWIGRRKNLKIG